MNRIDELFQRRDRNVLSVYFTAGYPELNDTNLIINGLEQAGADLIEIGFPFSDPVADGPVIQASSHKALENGMNLDILFGQLSEIKETSRIPKIMMGYFNTVYQFGVSKFIKACSESGISGVIIPDLPPEVYLDEYQGIFKENDIHFICLVSPQTPQDRAEYLATISKGFLYLLSSSGTTGGSLTQLNHFNHFNHFNIPTMIGFGIHDHESFALACQQANGAIIGSEFIRRQTAEERLRDDKTLRRGEERLRDDKTLRREIIREVCVGFVNEIRGIV